MEELRKLSKKFGDWEILKPQNKEFFESSGLEEVKLDIIAIQSQQEMTQTMMNMTRLDPFLTGMTHFEKALVALGFQETPQVMAYVWGPIRFLLKTTSPEEKAFDNVLDAYEKLGCDLPRLCQYLRLFGAIPEVNECLVHIYDDVLTFHQLSYRLFSRKKKLWQKLRRPIWKNWDHYTFTHLAKSLASTKSFITSHGASTRDKTVDIGCTGEPLMVDHEMAQSQDWSTARDDFRRYCVDRKERQRNFDIKETERMLGQRNKILEWIAASKNTQFLHEKFQGMRICPDTGRWLFRKYRMVSDWMKEEEPSESALWLHGSRGFGKTVLSSLVVDELQKLTKMHLIPDSARIYYFYCQEGDPDLTTLLGLLKGIIHQMVEVDDNLLAFCHDRMMANGNTTLESVDVAQNLVETYFEHNPRQYVIIDGLDECEHKEDRQIAKFFMTQVIKNDAEDVGRLRVLIMSQPMPEIRVEMNIMLEDDAYIELNANDNAGDIKKYIKKRIPEFSMTRSTTSGFNLSDSDREQLEAIICNRSQDMFLYAYLAIEYLLQQPNKGILLEKIQGDMLPSELSQIYERVLGSIRDGLTDRPEGHVHWEMAKRLLGWMVCAKRPLMWHEMQSILSYDAKNQIVDFDNKMLRQTMRTYLGSLVHILPGGRIRLIHSTARRHIVQNKHINELAVECDLSILCLRYLCLPCFSEHYGDNDRLREAPLGWFSFQDYACSQWHRHIDTIITKCRSLFDNDKMHFEWAPKLEGALQSFISAYEKDLATELHPELDHSSKELASFDGLSFHKNLRTLWNHIYCHQSQDNDVRNTVGITQLGKALIQNRLALEKNFTPSAKACLEDTIEDYYGPNLFKCKRTLCPFFYTGFEKEKDRDAHDKRHERPFPCPNHCRLNPIGFSSPKDRDKHVRIYHPEVIEEQTLFEALSSRIDTARFKCTICEKSFTRKINLKGHERSHFGDRPYSCATCSKPFARVNDCRRHEKIHARRGAR